jgi:hypothetical protein
MKKRHTLNMGGVICIIALVYIIYRVLLLNDMLPFSIYSVQLSMNHWLKHWHVIVVGLIPVYIALVFFSALICGVFFGSAAQRWIFRFCKKKK